MSNSDPIFILGITYRSGTNYLYDLLKQHPDCQGANPYEDFLIAHSEYLTQYVHETTFHWSKEWGVDPSALDRAIGQGLLSLIAERTAGKRAVTKTPSVRNLENFFRFFPQACLLLLVRDGRSVVESGVQGFGWEYEPAMWRWAEAANSILQFINTSRGAGGRYLLVRYEDLVFDLESEMRRIMSFLELDSVRYDFESVRHLPVRGSSVFRDGQGVGVNWGKVGKTQDFKPLERWRDWPRHRHDRFNWIAGRPMLQLGYNLEPTAMPDLAWKLTNRLKDWQWRVKMKVQNRLKR